MSPTALSVTQLEAQGYLVDVVEHWIPKSRRRRDLFGFLDILAVRADEVLGVQATTRDHISHSVTKIRTHDHWPRVAASGIRVEVHGWDTRDGAPRCKIVPVERTPTC